MTARIKVGAATSVAGAPVAGQYQSYPLVSLALVLLTTLVVYWPALNGAPLWDDEAHITKPDMRSIAGLYRIWFDPGATQQYYPLLHSAFWIEHRLWGDSVVGYHLVSMLWHMASVVLLYLILVRLKVPGALLAAAIFAVHPVMVESVAWISEQKNTLSGMFYLAALLVYLRFDESRRRAAYALALTLFVLGLLTKTVTATLPAALLVIFWWQRGKLSWKRDILPLAPFFALGAAAGILTAWVERTLIGAEGADFELSVLQRLLLAGRVVWFYLGKLIWPTNLTFIYPRWTIDPGVWWQWLFPAAAIGVTLCLWINRRHWPGSLACWLLFVGTLIPVLGFVNVFPFLYSFVADHFQYLASLGMIVLAASGIAKIVSRLTPPFSYVANGLCVLAVGGLAALSFRQTSIYLDKVTLYRATLASNPDCWMAHNNLGEILARTDHAEAIAHYEAAIRIRRDYPQAHNNLGYELTQVGRTPEAIGHIEEALRLRPDFVEANLNLGIALRQMDRTEEAIQRLQELLQKRPGYAEARSNLAQALIQAGRVPEGIAEFRTAIKQRPDDATLLNNYGIELIQIGRVSDALEPLEQAVRVKPNYYQARNSFGLALANIGKWPEAIEQFNRALDLNPNYANAHTNLADVFASQGDKGNAIRHYRRAIEIRPELVQLQYKLGRVLVQSGQPDEARAHFEAAIRFKPDDLQSYASLAQTLALLNRRPEAIAVAEKGIEIARGGGKQDELKQFEDWLKDYMTNRRAVPQETPPNSSAIAPKQ